MFEVSNVPWQKFYWLVKGVYCTSLRAPQPPPNFDRPSHLTDMSDRPGSCHMMFDMMLNYGYILLNYTSADTPPGGQNRYHALLHCYTVK